LRNLADERWDLRSWDSAPNPKPADCRKNSKEGTEE